MSVPKRASAAARVSATLPSLNDAIVSTVKILDEAAKFDVPALKLEDQIVCRGAFSYSPESAHPKSNSVSVLGIPLSPLHRRGRG